MTLLILEAFAALAVLVFIVWWTMFSGRRGGERRLDEPVRPPARRDRDRGSNGGSNDSSDGDGSGGGDGGGGD